jgi:hypothetical protein
VKRWGRANLSGHDPRYLPMLGAPYHPSFHLITARPSRPDQQRADSVSRHIVLGSIAANCTRQACRGKILVTSPSNYCIISGQTSCPRPKGRPDETCDACTPCSFHLKIGLCFSSHPALLQSPHLVRRDTRGRNVLQADFAALSIQCCAHCVEAGPRVQAPDPNPRYRRYPSFRRRAPPT